MTRAILINANEQMVHHVTIGDKHPLADLQGYVGGYIQAALRLERDHVLFVDEEGLFKPQRWFFRLRGVDRPFAGNGIIVGAEMFDDAQEYVGMNDVTLPLAAVARAVEFLNRTQADAWAKANASDPEITFTPEGEPTEVIARCGAVWGAMPRPEGDKQ